LLESRVVNRTATFAFYLGDRYFGTLTALVPGEQAGQFGFTSSLTAQILKTLLPQLQPHLYPQPPAPPVAKTEAIPAAEVVPAAEPAPTTLPPVKEKPDGSTSEADPPVSQQDPTQGGFPEDLEPNEVVPVPTTPLIPAAPPSSVPAAAPAP
jgi:hypothetical protein